MSTGLVAATVLAGSFTFYPPAGGPTPRIEAITEKGPILELIVRCPRGSAILSYSKIERLWCDPQLRCSANRTEVLERSCR